MKLSIIVTHYNRVRLCIEALDSIASNDCEQDLYEVILVDDCSTADVNDLKHYNRIKHYSFYTLDKNSGTASVPRNYGIDKAVGQYVMFLDSDDTISAGFLRKTIGMALENDCDLVIAKKISQYRAKIFRDINNDVPLIDADRPGEWHDFLMQDNYTVGRLFRLEILRRYDIKFPVQLKKREDFCFNKVFYALQKSVAICASEVYIAKDAEVGSNNLSLVEADEVHLYYLFSYLLHSMVRITDSAVGPKRKAVVVNFAVSCVVSNTPESAPEFFRLVREEIMSDLILVRREYKTKRRTRRFLDILICPPAKPIINNGNWSVLKHDTAKILGNGRVVLGCNKESPEGTLKLGVNAMLTVKDYAEFSHNGHIHVRNNAILTVGGVVAGVGVDIDVSYELIIGDNVSIGHDCIISDRDASDNQPIIIGNNVSIGNGCIIKTGIIIGDNTVINDFTEIGGVDSCMKT